jgi:hypothetical protein
MLDLTGFTERKKASAPARREKRHQALANAACDALELKAMREKYRPQYHHWYYLACKGNLEGELAEILKRTNALFMEGRVRNRGQYFLTSARNLLNPKK